VAQYTPPVSSSVLGLHRLLALGSLPEISALKGRDATGDRGLQEEDWRLLAFCTGCMLIVEQSEPLIVLL